RHDLRTTLSSLVSPLPRRRPSSTLFPYTTLFRSLPRRGPTGRRPAEEAVLTPPFGRTHGDPTGGPNVAAYDAEDVWRDVASHGTSNTPSDEPEAETITDGHDTWLLGQ